MFKKSLLLFAAISLSQTASAALYDRGNGLIYDDVLDITWLQDANYAKTSGYPLTGTGRMSWVNANDWADQLVYGGFDDWRLPSARNPIYPEDYGYNISSGELGHLFFNDLGGQSGSSCTPNCLGSSSFIDGATGLLVSFQNIQTQYWYREEYTGSADTAWGFNIYTGYQAYFAQDGHSGIPAWAVRDGDIIPIPAAAWLFGSALAGLGLVRKRQQV